MTLSTTVSRVSYPGTGSTGPFAFPFRIQDAADLRVTKRNAAGLETTLTNVTDYTVAGVDNAAGTLTLVVSLKTGETLVIRRAPALTQETSLRNGGPYFPSTVEDAFDLVAMQLQSLQDQLDRSLKLSEALDPAGFDLTLPDPEAGKVVTGTGTGFTMSTLDSSAVALPGGGRTVSTLSAYLANNAVANVLDFATPGIAVNDGVHDWGAAAQAAHDSLGSTGGIILFPPGNYRLIGTGATLVAPKIGCSITKDRVWIEGYGATVDMYGWTQADAAGQNDGGGGANVFTCFLWNNGVTGGGIRGFVFNGHSTGAAHTVSRARAKAIGMDGCSNVTAEHCWGYDIVGNLVNARGGSGGLGDCTAPWVFDCHAERCSENGFNFMGGTYFGKLCRCTGKDNKYAGFETACMHIICTENLFYGNKNGISQVGNYGIFGDNILYDNTFAGMDFQHNDATFAASFNLVNGSLLIGNGAEGALASANANGNALIANLIADNASLGIDTLSPTSLITVLANMIADFQNVPTQTAAIQFLGGDKAVAAFNRFYGHITSSVITTSPADSQVFWDNISDKGMSLSGATTNTSPRRNQRYLTENNFTATIGAGVTSVVANHGLSKTPTVIDILVTPITAWGAATKWWWDTPTATQITIHCDIAPGGAGFGFAVQGRIL